MSPARLPIPPLARILPVTNYYATRHFGSGISAELRILYTTTIKPTTPSQKGRLIESFARHPLTHELNSRATAKLWLTFIVAFSKENELVKPRQVQERKLARQALSALKTDRSGITLNLQAMYNRPVRGVPQDWRRQEVQPFLPYLDALRTGENGALHREAIYGRYLHLLDAFRTHYRSRRANGMTSADPYIGAGHELVAGALFARLRHPNILFLPALDLQDSSLSRRANHDYVYIDTFGDTPIVQPTQVKSTYAAMPHLYDPNVAMLVGEDDLHLCPLTGQDCQAVSAAQCVAEQTVDYLLHESSPEQCAALDALTNGLLLKLSDWQDNAQEWQKMISHERNIRRYQKRYRHQPHKTDAPTEYLA